MCPPGMPPEIPPGINPPPEITLGTPGNAPGVEDVIGTPVAGSTVGFGGMVPIPPGIPPGMFFGGLLVATPPLGIPFGTIARIISE